MSETKRKEWIDEMDVREWFKTADIEQARDTFRVVEGILEMRAERSATGRRRRKDAGKPRTIQETFLPDQDGQANG